MSTTKIDLQTFYIDNIHPIMGEDGACLSVLIDLISTEDASNLEIAVLPNNMAMIPSRVSISTTMELETLEGLNLNAEVMAVLNPVLEYSFSTGAGTDAPHLNCIQSMHDNGELEYDAFVPASTILYDIMELVDEHNDPVL